VASRGRENRVVAAHKVASRAVVPSANLVAVVAGHSVANRVSVQHPKFKPPSGGFFFARVATEPA
jgi:hypothetical protein